MYQKYYQLNWMPFENTPDPRFFYASDDHREALASIEYTIRMRKGIILVSGEIGSGKTTISHTLQSRIADAATTIIVRQGLTSASQFLRQVARSLKLELPNRADRGELIDSIEKRLLEYHNINSPVVLIVDEAQAQSESVLQEIRLLSNVETTESKLIQVVLIGQPELREMIAVPGMAALRQRIVLSYHLRPLNYDNATRYIEHRLDVASGEQEPAVKFDAEALQKIHQFTGGVPRLINVVADNCLLVGYVRSARVIDTRIVDAVTENLVPHSGIRPDAATSSSEPPMAQAA